MRLCRNSGAGEGNVLLEGEVGVSAVRTRLVDPGVSCGSGLRFLGGSCGMSLMENCACVSADFVHSLTLCRGLIRMPHVS